MLHMSYYVCYNGIFQVSSIAFEIQAFLINNMAVPARCLSCWPDVAGGAPQGSLPKDWESHCWLLADVDVWWKWGLPVAKGPEFSGSCQSRIGQKRKVV